MRGLKKFPSTLNIVDTFFPKFFFRECAKKIFYILSMKFPHASWNHFDCIHEGFMKEFVTAFDTDELFFEVCVTEFNLYLKFS